jgi:hypothetical protein
LLGTYDSGKQRYGGRAKATGNLRKRGLVGFLRDEPVFADVGRDSRIARNALSKYVRGLDSTLAMCRVFVYYMCRVFAGWRDA